MSDKRNPDYPPHPQWDACSHKWKENEWMSERSVFCTECGAPGEQEEDDSVYWPAT